MKITTIRGPSKEGFTAVLYSRSKYKRQAAPVINESYFCKVSSGEPNVSNEKCSFLSLISIIIDNSIEYKGIRFVLSVDKMLPIKSMCHNLNQYLIIKARIQIITHLCYFFFVKEIFNKRVLL